MRSVGFEKHGKQKRNCGGTVGACWRGSGIDRESIGGRLKAGDRAITRGWMAGTFPFSDDPSSTVTLYNVDYISIFPAATYADNAKNQRTVEIKGL